MLSVFNYALWVLSEVIILSSYGISQNSCIKGEMCGVLGIVSNMGQEPVATGEACDFLVTGPMCKYARDLLPMYQVLAASNTHLLKLDTQVGTVWHASLDELFKSLFISKILNILVLNYVWEFDIIILLHRLMWENWDIFMWRMMEALPWSLQCLQNSELPREELSYTWRRHMASRQRR